jgi:hypothetical protein
VINLRLITQSLFTLLATLYGGLSLATEPAIIEIAAHFETKTSPVDPHLHRVIKQPTARHWYPWRLQDKQTGQKQPKATEQWYLWRQQDKIEIQSHNKQIGEVWQRLKHKQVAFSWLYHAKAFAIRYTPSDLKALQTYPDWATKTSIVSPALSERLQKISNKQVLGYKADIYRENIDNYQLEIHWIPAINTPAKIRQTDNKQTTEVKLLAVYPLADAPWQPIESDHYDDMDYADIGDNESHPIAKLHMKGMSLNTIRYQAHGH